MARTKSPSYVLTLKLNTDASDEAFLNKRMFLSCKVHNQLVSHAGKQLRKMYSDYRYKVLMEQWNTTKNSSDSQMKHLHHEICDRLKELRLEYGLSEYRMHDYVQKQQRVYKQYLGSQTCQLIASDVWNAVERCLFGKGRTVHYKRASGYDILHGSRTNASYMVFDKDARTVRIGRYEIPVSIDYGDLYVCYALQDRVKYCRIIRKQFSSGYRYYLQLVMEGIPLRKHAVADGRIGIDIGTSAVAAVSSNGIIFTELGNDVKDYSRKISRIQRAMDRSRRAGNPNKYNSDGTIRKGNSDRWVYSKSCKRLAMKKRTLERKQADSLKHSHGRLSNDIIVMGNDIYVEQMDFAALQKRKRQTTRSESGRFHRKGRFGRSLKSHAPAMLVSMIDRKLKYYGYGIHKVNTKTFRASQYNHITDDYVKKKLGMRSGDIGGTHIQRDLYSAFLLMNSCPDLDRTDRQLCLETFDNFVRLHDRCMQSLTDEYLRGRKFPSCMGIRDFVTC